MLLQNQLCTEKFRMKKTETIKTEIYSMSQNSLTALRCSIKLSHTDVYCSATWLVKWINYLSDTERRSAGDTLRKLVQ